MPKDPLETDHLQALQTTKQGLLKYFMSMHKKQQSLACNTLCSFDPWRIVVLDQLAVVVRSFLFTYYCLSFTADHAASKLLCGVQ